MNRPSPKAGFIGIINEKDDMKITTIVEAAKPHRRINCFCDCIFDL
jgi:hypothetical protein